MARPREPVPEPLPPAERTVGQLVAESIRLYGRRFWQALLLGVPVAALDVLFFLDVPRVVEVVVWPLVGSLLLSIAFVGAAVIVRGSAPSRRAAGVAFTIAFVLFVPFPLLNALVPSLGVPTLTVRALLLAYVGMAVPAAVIEDLNLLAAVRRGAKLGLADYVHALGALAALTVIVFLTGVMLTMLLVGTADASVEVASVLAHIVCSPLFFLGAALLYVDQEARVRESRGRRVQARQPAA